MAQRMVLSCTACVTFCFVSLGCFELVCDACIPELGLVIDPDESSMAPLRLRVIPMQPPIATCACVRPAHRRTHRYMPVDAYRLGAAADTLISLRIRKTARA